MTRPGEDTETLDLLRRWHVGDESALGELVRRDLSWICEHVRDRLGPKLRARAETMDVVQDAMVQVLKDGPRFLVADGGKFRRLIAAIVENVLRNANREMLQQRRNVDRERKMPTSGVLDLDGTSPSDAAERSEDTAWLELAVELLAPSDREVVVLRQWDGCSFAEIGARLGIREDAARVRFHRALGRLGPLMKRLRQGELGAILAERTPDDDAI